MVSKSTGRSNSVQQTRLAAKTNHINFNQPLKIAVIFKRFSGKFLKPQLGNYKTKTLRITLDNQTLSNKQFRTDYNLHFTNGNRDSRENQSPQQPLGLESRNAPTVTPARAAAKETTRELNQSLALIINFYTVNRPVSLCKQSTASMCVHTITDS